MLGHAAADQAAGAIGEAGGQVMKGAVHAGAHAVLADTVEGAGAIGVEAAVGSTKDLPSFMTDAGNCDAWRDAICTIPVKPHKIVSASIGAFLSSAETAAYSVLGGKRAASSSCMCRPSDCAVWSKKHRGFKCVFSRNLDLGGEIVQDYESLSRFVYDNVSKALGGYGYDDPADFFEKRAGILRQHPDQSVCLDAMYYSADPVDGKCKEHVCSFAEVATGHFPFAVKHCDIRRHKASGSSLAYLVLLVFLVAVLAGLTSRKWPSVHQAPHSVSDAEGPE